jgi:cycloeucalenol cycloisomerase
VEKATTPRWFSANLNKAWTEKFFLIYSPIWMIQMGVMMVTGWAGTFGDKALLAQAIIMTLPLYIVPLFFSPESRSGIVWHKTHWFRANLYLLIFSFLCNYIGSEYFFDILGMVYNFPNATTTLNAVLLGNSDQKVPLIMHILTICYFMTYHTTAILVLRRIRTSGLPQVNVIFVIALFVAGYVWSWAETKAMANPLMSELFYYTNMDAMLKFGSAIYATFFIASFPIYYFVDENPDEPWDIVKIVFAAFGATMIMFLLLEMCARYVGHI